jgi:hypothetical protein
MGNDIYTGIPSSCPFPLPAGAETLGALGALSGCLQEETCRQPHSQGPCGSSLHTRGRNIFRNLILSYALSAEIFRIFSDPEPLCTVVFGM